ncbi:hypothetical protein [Pseudomonas syringae]|uniref:hypothetical protein n=1 Tax=Pseudomonas syringae TaxID=317 RepID=UPI001605139D|nr:hypothetical protein [Pseudomonas syringae]
MQTNEPRIERKISASFDWVDEWFALKSSNFLLRFGSKGGREPQKRLRPKEALIYSIFRPCNALEALIYQGATAGF